MAEVVPHLTYDEVIQAAAVIASSGRKASSVAVREKLGRGSFSTIKKHLDRWLIGQEPVTDRPASPLPPQLESLWQEARREAERSLADEHQALQKLSEQLDVRWNEMEAQVEAANGRCAHAAQRVADKDDELARLAAHLDDIHAQHSKATAQGDVLSQALALERDVGARRLDTLERRIGELTRVLTALTEPLAAVPARISAVGDFVEGELGQMRQDLFSRHERDHSELKALIAPSQALLASLSDQLNTHFERERRALRRRPNQCFPRVGTSRFWDLKRT